MQVGAPIARKARHEGNGPFPVPTLLEDALDISIPSREEGREIPCRLVYPKNRRSEEERKACAGVVCHIHGGGWVVSNVSPSWKEYLMIKYGLSDC